MARCCFIFVIIIFFIFFLPPIPIFAASYPPRRGLFNDDEAEENKDDGIIIAESDLQALLSIRQSFQDPSHSLLSWNVSSSSGACSGLWIGVKCARGQVIALQLSARSLSGVLSPSIGQLFALRKLNLHSNSIAGAIPSSISSLPRLRALYLNRNQFTGSIPAGLANSPFLQRLDLSHNSLSGSLPPFVSIAQQFDSSSIAQQSNSSIAQQQQQQPQSNSSSSKLSIDLSFNNLSSPLNSSSFSGLPSLLELRLSHNSLFGPIPPDLLHFLPSLSSLDLSHNHFNDSFSLPSSDSLSLLDISFNSISGPLPDSIGSFSRLQFFDASHNAFSFPIPPQLANLTGLQSLDLSFNQFNGTIPPSLADLKNLTDFNCSFNQLTGKIPPFVQKFSPSSFEGNAGLCGYDASVACAFQAQSPSSPTVASTPSRSDKTPPPANANSSHGSAHRPAAMVTILIITLCSVGAGVLMICLTVAAIFCRRAAGNHLGEEEGKSGSEEDGMGGSDDQKAGGGPSVVRSTGGDGGSKDGGSGEVGGGKLVHFDGAMVRFTADRLLCATAEVLGKSTYGTVYKATFEDGSEVAVKRLREGIVKSQRDFEMEVNLLGKIRHLNLLSLRGYYWGPKNEKLLIYDFMAGGSLSAFLHARGPETPLTWHTRLNIAAGTAKGLVHLHNVERIIHGNLTSSNVLLDSRMNAKISDFGLSRLMTASANANVVATASALGYRAPELTKLRKATTKTDVYSFGVILLELLTGKSPAESSSGDQTAGMDLPEWVASIVKEEWTNEIFDLELMKGPAPSEDELINTLQLAMNCVTPSAASRPAMEEVCQQLEETLNRPDQQRGGGGKQQQCQTTSSDSSAM